jgi:hypothetical protein
VPEGADGPADDEAARGHQAEEDRLDHLLLLPHRMSPYASAAAAALSRARGSGTSTGHTSDDLSAPPGLDANDTAAVEPTYSGLTT